MRKAANILILGLFISLMLSAGGAQQPQDKAPTTLNWRDFTVHLVGHAHIDLAWLWRWEETIHDIATHTFVGTLAQMDKMPGLTFAQSQAAVYEIIEQKYPEIFQKIKDKVKAGTWIPVGGMWAEPDLNMPDGEALARQLLYGKKYFSEKFGIDVTVGWNPDSFGHNFQLPQVLSKAGIKYYVFERCAPQNTPVFWWEGLDGSRILSYVPPGWYLVDLRNGVQDLISEAAKTTPLKDFMLLYGEGDHGGGPRNTDVEAISRFKDDPAHPQIEFVTPQDYFKKLESAGIDFLVIKKELNFTFPACYTTQAKTKKNNRQLENLLLTAERFSALAITTGSRDYYPERDIDEAWKIVLRQQFHDILDGSSIGPVYEEAEDYYNEARSRGNRAVDFSLETLTNQIDTRGQGRPLVVYNPLFWERTEPVECSIGLTQPVKAIRVLDDQGADVPYQGNLEQSGKDHWIYRIIFLAEKVPSFGYKTFRVVDAEMKPEFKTSLHVERSTIENAFLRITLDPKTGWMRSLFDKRSGREALSGPGNVLQAIVDEPESMSAWELGLKSQSWNIGENGAQIEILEKGPVRSIIRIKSHFRDSHFVQDIMLYHNLARVDVRLRMDWQERNLMIKAAFPAAVRNTQADFEIPFGFVSRPTDGTEVPALKWIDLTDESGQYGLSLLNDSKYGFDVKNNVLRISLVHGATSPDPEADRGEHETVYSLFPHAGNWQEAMTFRKGYEHNIPLIARIGLVHSGPFPPVQSFFRVEPGNIILSALKKESDYFSRALILRLYETIGKETEAAIEFPMPAQVQETDLIERPLAKIETDGNIVRFKMKPFEIKTIQVILKPRRST